MFLKIKNFLKKEVVFCISAVCAAVTMFLVVPDKEYLGYIDFKVLCLLMCLMLVVDGFKSIGVFKKLTYLLMKKIRNGRILGLTLVLLPFFCSMLVTNDVALLVFVPFTLALLSELDCENKIIPIVVLQTVAANLGSMATPVGNPQNLFLYSTYNLSAADFFSVTLPLTAVSLLCISIAGLFCVPNALVLNESDETEITSAKSFALYTVLFLLCLLTVFKFIPYQITTVLIISAFFINDKKLLKKIDYMLLLTFVCFFVVSGNLGRIDAVREFLQSLLSVNTLLTSVGTSQIISNVPAAVLLSTFTENWKELLCGVNIGGLGTPVASLASLISLKLYVASKNSKVLKFLGVFTLVNIILLFILLLFTFRYY